MRWETTLVMLNFIRDVENSHLCLVLSFVHFCDTDTCINLTLILVATSGSPQSLSHHGWAITNIWRAVQ